MIDFSADWLTLRAGADASARDPDLVTRLAGHFAGSAQVSALDLGAGTGASVRALAPVLDTAQHWILADADAKLLARVDAPEGVSVDRRHVDLGAGLAALFDPPPDLVTASAFFDLCGTAFIEALVARTAACGAVLYAALSYDGREGWRPPHPLDAQVLAAFHSDQRRDKGLGTALGPGAHAHLAACLAGRGYRVAEATSDWDLAQPADAALIVALAEGTAAAVAPQIGAERAEAWRAARTRARRVTIGHRDLLALPTR